VEEFTTLLSKLDVELSTAADTLVVDAEINEFKERLPLSASPYTS
jgi:hypothetical protein